MEDTNQLTQWEVFIQAKSGSAFEHAGSLHASDQKMALQNARDVYTRRNEGRGLWLVPTHCIVASSRDDEEAFFDPAEDKTYRNPNFYKMPKGSSNI